MDNIPKIKKSKMFHTNDNFDNTELLEIESEKNIKNNENLNTNETVNDIQKKIIQEIEYESWLTRAQSFMKSLKIHHYILLGSILALPTFIYIKDLIDCG